MSSALSSQIQSTAGAIPVLNEKGEISMQKVKVHRYISGRRPKYAPEESSEGESEDEFPFERRLGEGVSIAATTTMGGVTTGAMSIGPKSQSLPGEGDETMEVEQEPSEAEKLDRRLRRLQQREYEDVEDKYERHRHIHEPQVLSKGPAEDEALEDDDEDDEDKGEDAAVGERPARVRWNRDQEDTSDEDEELDDQAFEQRRALLRQKAVDKAVQEEVLVMDEDEGKSEESESSEYEEYTDSEEEEMGQRLKPVFVRKKDRITVQEKEDRLQKEKELEIETKKMADERRRQSVKLVEQETRKEIMEQKKFLGGGLAAGDPSELLATDDENDEAAYESWKLRELKRIKRDKEERENYEKDRIEVERLHNLTEEERRAEQRLNPRQITNKAAKGKYKFLQKYYHRGAFYLNDEDNVLRRDFSSPTLEDHFNKTILPKVMQVKNFGRSGRTKYTHLVDQDTTVFDSPWMSETAHNLKFHTNQAGGMKQVFDRPSLQKRKKTS